MEVISHDDDHYKDVKWDDYNFPPLLNIYHFSMSEISKDHKPHVSKLFIVFWLTVLCLLINLGNEIAFMFMNAWTFKQQLYSILNIAVITPLAAYIFIKGMHTIVRFKSDYKWYMCLSFPMTLVYVAACILNKSSFHGLMYMFKEFGKNKLAGLLSLIEIFFWACLTFLNSYTMHLVRTYHN